MTENELSQLLHNHLRAAVANGIILLAGVYILGIIAGSGLGMWADRRVGALAIAGLCTLIVAWVMWMYYRTAGLMHQGAGAISGERAPKQS